MHQKIRFGLALEWLFFIFTLDGCGIKNIVNNLQEMGYIVRILYAPNGNSVKIKDFLVKKNNICCYD